MPWRRKKIRAVFIKDSAFGCISGLNILAEKNETGGAMVGYVSVDGSLVVTNVCGPGEGGVCEPNRVLIDGAAATRFCESEFDKTKGAVRYVGDWHIHRSMNLTPSAKDLKALWALPRSNDWGYPIVSLILSDDLSEYLCFYYRLGIRLVDCYRL